MEVGQHLPLARALLEVRQSRGYKASEWTRYVLSHAEGLGWMTICPTGEANNCIC